MMERVLLFFRANSLIAVLHALVQQSGKLGLTDIHSHAETFYRDLLRIVCDYDLQNVNLFQKNFPAIDLAEGEGGVCIQVTSTEGAKKVRDTLKKFKSHGFEQSYSRLIILVMGESAAKGAKPTTLGPAFVFDPKVDIWDTDNLLSKINDLKLEKLRAVTSFLSANIKMPEPDPLPREVETLISMFQMLSAAEVVATSEFPEEPDPNRKMSRFAEHFDFLMGRYADLYGEYGELLADVKQTQGITQQQYRRAGIFLKGMSDRVLTECRGEPANALRNLIAHFGALLTRAEIPYDETAVEFFMLDELINCNVFPNRKASHG